MSEGFKVGYKKWAKGPIDNGKEVALACSPENDCWGHWGDSIPGAKLKALNSCKSNTRQTCRIVDVNLRSIDRLSASSSTTAATTSNVGTQGWCATLFSVFEATKTYCDTKKGKWKSTYQAAKAEHRRLKNQSSTVATTSNSSKKVWCATRGRLWSGKKRSACGSAKAFANRYEAEMEHLRLKNQPATKKVWCATSVRVWSGKKRSACGSARVFKYEYQADVEHRRLKKEHAERQLAEAMEAEQKRKAEEEKRKAEEEKQKAEKARLAEEQSKNSSDNLAGLSLEPMDKVFQVPETTNIRAAPKVLSERVGRINAGETLTILAKVSGERWYLVETDQGERGFLPQEHLRLKNQSSTAATTTSNSSDEGWCVTDTGISQTSKSYCVSRHGHWSWTYKEALKERNRLKKQSSAVATKTEADESKPESHSSQTVADDKSALELEFWQSIKDSDDPVMYQAHLDQFPDGTFSSLAKQKLKQIAAAERERKEATPSNPSEYYHNARLYAQRGDLDLALATYEKAFDNKLHFVDPLLDVILLTTRLYGIDGAKLYIERKLKPALSLELYWFAQQQLIEEPMPELLERLVNNEIDYPPLLALLSTYPRAAIDGKKYTWSERRAVYRASKRVQAAYSSGKFLSHYIDPMRGEMAAKNAQSLQSYFGNEQISKQFKSPVRGFFRAVRPAKMFEEASRNPDLFTNPELWPELGKKSVSGTPGGASLGFELQDISDLIDLNYPIEVCVQKSPTGSLICFDLLDYLIPRKKTGSFSPAGGGSYAVAPPTFGAACIDSVSYTDTRGRQLKHQTVFVKYDTRPEYFPVEWVHQIEQCTRAGLSYWDKERSDSQGLVTTDEASTTSTSVKKQREFTSADLKDVWCFAPNEPKKIGYYKKLVCDQVGGLSFSSEVQARAELKRHARIAKVAKAAEPVEAANEQPVSVDPKAIELELEFWQSIKDSDDPDMFREYLRQFPSGTFEGIAKIKIQKLSGSTTSVAQASVPDLDYGRYHALVIGNNRYRHLKPLSTAVNDANAVASLLRSQYQFNVDVLINATRDETVSALSRLRKSISQQDNLLIYYAGHGWLDTEMDEGFWLPVDARDDDQVDWIANDTIMRSVRAMKAKHVMVVADSCFSGTLIRGIMIKERSPDYIREISQKKARTALTSGGVEPVTDVGGGGHSIFAATFIRILSENDGVLDGHQLFTTLRKRVMMGADQTPEYGDIRKAGHDGGDFLFVRR